MTTLRHCPVLLIGTNDAQKAFRSQFDKDDVMFSGIDYTECKVNDKIFNIWTTNGREQGIIFDTFAQYVEVMDAIIYLDDEDHKQYEERRNKKTCIAINFNSFNHTPKECLDKIAFLKQEEPKLVLSEKQISDNAQMLWLARSHDQQSSLNIFPKEIVKVICETADSVKNAYRRNNIFYKCPPVEKESETLTMGYNK